MNRPSIVREIRQHGIIAIVRASVGGPAIVHAVEALVEAGLGCVEITLNTPGAEAAIAEAAGRLAGSAVLLGAGTVLDADACHRAIDAGARFVVSPVTDPDVIAAAHARGVPVLPGAYTPNEIVRAWNLGADLVKLFPADHGGLAYLKAVRAPLRDIPLVPTGGVTPDNLADFLGAGAVAVGVGGALVPEHLLRAGDVAAIAANARRFADALRRARHGDES